MLASRLAGTAVRMDCHGNQPRLPSGMARATAATGLHGVSRVLFFLGRGCGRLVAGVAGAGSHMRTSGTRASKSVKRAICGQLSGNAYAVRSTSLGIG